MEKPKDYAILLTFRPTLFIMGNFQNLQYLTTKYVSFFFFETVKKHQAGFKIMTCRFAYFVPTYCATLAGNIKG